jgi:HK97 family phage major capsid protein
MGQELTEQDVELIGVRVKAMTDSLEEWKERADTELDKRVDDRVERIRSQLVEQARGRNAPAKGGLSETRDTAGFASFAELASAVRFDPGDRRLQALAEKREMGTSPGSAGGYAIPDGFVDQLFAIPASASIFQGRITMLPPGNGAIDAPTSFPALDQTGSRGILAGVEVGYVAEGTTVPSTDAVLRQVTVTPHEIAARIVVSDKALRNWSSSMSVLPMLLGQATAKLIDEDCYSGSGTGITGYLGHDATITVDRSVASEVNYIDCCNMVSRALKSMGDLVWIVSNSALPQFISMTDGAGNLICLNGNAGMDVRDGQLFSFLGLPLFVLDSASTLGSEGDVSLIAPKGIVGRQGFGPRIEASPHVYFQSAKTVLRVTTCFDARPWLSAPLTLGDGSTVSPFVVLK